VAFLRAALSQWKRDRASAIVFLVVGSFTNVTAAHGPFPAAPRAHAFSSPARHPRRFYPFLRSCLGAGAPCPGRIWAQDRLEQAPAFGEERMPTALSPETCSCRGSGVSLSVPRDGVRIAFRSGDALPDRLCGTSEHRTGVKVRNCGGVAARRSGYGPVPAGRWALTPRATRNSAATSRVAASAPSGNT
jgi:hypothetical protein